MSKADLTQRRRDSRKRATRRVPSRRRSLPALAAVLKWIRSAHKEGQRMQVFFAKKQAYELAAFQAGRTIALDDVRIMLNHLFREEPEGNNQALPEGGGQPR